jgi:DNA-binding response OmpR family regulator
MDWVRSPCDPDELIVRRSNLEARYIRSREGPRPHLDCETGRLTFGRSTVDLSLPQAAIMRVFLDRYREVVPAREVCMAFGATEDEGRPAIASRIMRLRRRLRVVGLEITLVRGLGYTLEPESEP